MFTDAAHSGAGVNPSLKLRHLAATEVCHLGERMRATAVVRDAQRFAGARFAERGFHPPSGMANDGRRQHRMQQRVELGECYVAVFQQASTRGRPARIRRIAIVDDRDMIGRDGDGSGGGEDDAHGEAHESSHERLLDD